MVSIMDTDDARSQGISNHAIDYIWTQLIRSLHIKG